MLFHAYCKIMKNRDLNKEGCGLGLTISRNLAEVLGGSISLYSKVGVGSKFIVELPSNLEKQDFEGARNPLFKNKQRGSKSSNP